MLTNLKWLNSGERFPPVSEKGRLEIYKQNKDLFEGEHCEVYDESLKRIERVIGNFEQVISYPVIINFQKLISLKTADLLLGELPQISCGEKGSKQQDTIDSIIENSDLWEICRQAVIDVSRYGDGLFDVRRKKDCGVVSQTQPPLWFPVVSPDDVKEILYHVIGWTFEGDDGRKRLKVRIHEAGKYEERLYFIEGNLIGNMIDSKVFPTGLSDCAIIQIPNTMTSDRCTGIDDYQDVDSIIAELMVRIGQISRILDKHASPSMSGPQTALEKDPSSGQWRLKAGNYFPRDAKDDPNVEYITWDGQLEANFKQVDKLINLLYTISEMGAAIFGDLNNQTGQVPSGSALRRLMISPLAKVSRIRNKLDTALKEALYLASELGGKGYVNLRDEVINITWADGLPEDAREMAEIMEIRTGKKATISRMSAIKKLDDMDDDGADEELAKILDDEQAADPLKAPTFGQDGVDKNGADVGDVAKDVIGKSLNGSQTQSLLSVLERYADGSLSIGQAINIVSVSAGVSKEEAKALIEGLE